MKSYKVEMEEDGKAVASSKVIENLVSSVKEAEQQCHVNAITVE